MVRWATEFIDNKDTTILDYYLSFCSITSYYCRDMKKRDHYTDLIVQLTNSRRITSGLQGDGRRSNYGAKKGISDNPARVPTVPNDFVACRVVNKNSVRAE